MTIMLVLMVMMVVMGDDDDDDDDDGAGDDILMITMMMMPMCSQGVDGGAPGGRAGVVRRRGREGGSLFLFIMVKPGRGKG
jgi:hypothetical protein